MIESASLNPPHESDSEARGWSLGGSAGIADIVVSGGLHMVASWMLGLCPVCAKLSRKQRGDAGGTACSMGQGGELTVFVLPQLCGLVKSLHPPKPQFPSKTQGSFSGFKK